LSLKDELLKLPKDVLVDFIIELSERLEKVEKKLRRYENSNVPTSKMPFREDSKRNKDNKEKNNDSDKNKRFPGRGLNHDGAGINIPKPDKVNEYKMEQKGFILFGKKTKYTIDIVENPIIVTKHIIFLYKDKSGNIIEAPNDVSDEIYGPRIQSLLTLMKSITGTSCQKLADIIKSLRTDLSICSATVLNLIDNVSINLTKSRKRLIKDIRNAPFSQEDETILRQDGKNGYVWVFCNPLTSLYEVDLTRSQDVPKRILGSDYDKPAVNDGYVAYKFLKKRQRCWPHLLRESDALALENKEAIPQALQLHEMYKQCIEAKKFTKKKRMGLITRLSSSTGVPHIISCLSTRTSCRGFATTLKNALPNMFLGVEHPEVPLDNNHSERQLKHVICLRKNAGCIRNEKGIRFVENTLSMIQTWRLRKIPVYKNLIKYTC